MSQDVAVPVAATTEAAPTGADPQGDEQRQLAGARAALLREFGDRLSEAQVEQVFQASVSRFAGAPIRSFVPLLAQRSVRRDLQRALDGS